MGLRYRARLGRLLAIMLAGAAFVAAVGGSVALAADTEELDPAVVERLFDQLQNSPAIEQNCNPCHGNISETDNYSSEIIFTHGNHIMIQCASCHTRFPHRPEGTARPTMKGCFDCHGVRHGPMGVLATGECNDCHMTEKTRLRPSFHPYDWRGKPHVDPANKEFNTRCTMCHSPASCNDCHNSEGIEWQPVTWEFDSSNGCLSCHGNPLLKKMSSGGGKSYQVTEVDSSVHRDLTCQQCHVDYRYDDKPSSTPLWTINASKACADCHKKASTGDPEKDKRLSDPVEAYDKSIHAEAIVEGNLESATCGSCHGGHFIYSTETASGAARMHQSAYRVCARCKQHGDDYDTYDDYYHGKAYKAGAPDSPSCWDCHASHEVQPRSDTESTVNDANVGATCGQEGCHKGSSDKFGANAAALIHQKIEAQEQNPLLRLIARIRGR